MDTIVGGTFCELDGAKSKRDSRDIVSDLSKCSFLLFSWPRVRGVIADLSRRRNGFNIMTLKIFFVVGIADFFNWSIGASAMRFGNSLWDAGREDRTVNGVCVIGYNFISYLYLFEKQEYVLILNDSDLANLDIFQRQNSLQNCRGTSPAIK